MTYEPYMRWSCDQCGRHGMVSAPAEADSIEWEYRVLEAHAIATDGACLSAPYRDEIELPDPSRPLRTAPLPF